MWLQHYQKFHLEISFGNLTGKASLFISLMGIPGERDVSLRPHHGHRDEALRLRRLTGLVDEEVREETPGVVIGRESRGSQIKPDDSLIH